MHEYIWSTNPSLYKRGPVKDENYHIYGASLSCMIHFSSTILSLYLFFSFLNLEKILPINLAHHISKTLSSYSDTHHSQSERTYFPATCNLWPATYSGCVVRPATCNMRPATSNLWPETYNLRPVTCVLRPVTCDLRFRPAGKNIPVLRCIEYYAKYSKISSYNRFKSNNRHFIHTCISILLAISIRHRKFFINHFGTRLRAELIFDLIKNKIKYFIK